MSLEASLFTVLCRRNGATPAELAAQLNCDVAAVNAALAELNRLGLDAHSHHGQVHTRWPPVPLDAARLQSALSPGQSLRVLLQCDSTNDRVALDEVLLSEHQSAGRGRRGRAWQASIGQSVLLSMRRAVDLPVQAVECLHLVVAAAVFSALQAQQLCAEVRLKWPNDLMKSAGKLCGVLIELRHHAGRVREIIAGVGLNWQTRGALLNTLDQPAAALHAPGPARDRNPFVASLIQSLNRATDDVRLGRLSEYMALWQRHDYLRNRHIVLHGGAPEAADSGPACGVCDDGSLLLQDADGAFHRIRAGEVSARPV